MLTFSKIERADLELCTRFSKSDERSKRAGDWGVVKDNFHGYSGAMIELRPLRHLRCTLLAIIQKVKYPPAKHSHHVRDAGGLDKFLRGCLGDDSCRNP
jgi:hypothetical protein